MKDYYSKYIMELHDLFKNATGMQRGQDLPIGDLMESWILETRKAAESGRQFFFAGNGASATMVEHLGFDALQNAFLKTINFAETAYLTAISNDLSFEDVFLPKLNLYGQPGDMLITVSSSGNSPNIVKALKLAKELGILCVTLSGMKPDNQSRALGDLSIHVPAPTYGLAESTHAAILHCWLDMYMEKYLGGRH